nr:hypothetical protein [Tanacetum cinerariifolium]
MGFDDAYLPIRSNILTREPLPSMKTAFAVVSGEESHRSIASIRTSPKPSATAFVAKSFDNNKKFQQGYPLNYKKPENQNSDKYTVNNSISAPSPSTTPTMSFSNEQMLKLLSLIDDKSGSNSVANMAEWGGRGVKEKNKDVAAKDGVSSSVTDETVVKEKQSSLVDTSIPTAEMDKLSSLDDTTALGSFPSLSTPVTTTAGNAPSKSSYANVTGILSGKKLNIRTLFTPGGNEIHVVVPMESIRAIRYTKEVTKSNPFEVLTSVNNDVDLGTNEGILISADKGTNNVVHDDGNPLVPTSIVESDSEVEVVFDETANLRISMSDKDGSDKDEIEFFKINNEEIDPSDHIDYDDVVETMGTIRETLTEGEEGALHLGPERDQVFTDLSPKEKDRVKETFLKFFDLNTSSLQERRTGFTVVLAVLIIGASQSRQHGKSQSSYKVGKVSQNQRDLPRDNPLVSVEVLRCDIKRSKSENKIIVSTEMELVLEQTQQGTSHEVSISTEGVGE